MNKINWDKSAVALQGEKVYLYERLQRREISQRRKKKITGTVLDIKKREIGEREKFYGWRDGCKVFWHTEVHEDLFRCSVVVSKQNREVWGWSGLYKLQGLRLLQLKASREMRGRCLGSLFCSMYYGHNANGLFFTHMVWKNFLGQGSIVNFTIWCNSRRASLLGAKLW